MVLEAILSYDKIKSNPWYVFLLGVILSSIAVLVSLGLFRNQGSLIMVFFTCIVVFHFIYYAIKSEEMNDILMDGEKKILRAHSKTILLFMMLFLGFLFSYSFWALVLPDHITQTLFSVQYQTISNLNSAVSGSAVSAQYAGTIFINNLKVLFFCILFSFLYGAGAIFILTWNASVGGAFIGNFVKTKLLSYSSAHAITLGLVRYLPHGIPEMAGYFVGALAGGIISVAIIRKDFGSRNFFKIIFDSTELIIIAVLLLGLGTIIEVWITPNLVNLLS